MPSSLPIRTPRKALSKSGSGSFEPGDPNAGSGSSELDSLSTVSGESEEQLPPKEKPIIPGMDPSSEKQEKIRLKNERKHQRHKERKRKELRERCKEVLMHRKLETLVYQLTSMGFTSDRASAALVLNDGDVEKSIAFLLDCDGSSSLPKPGELPLKLDISQELQQLGEIEAKGFHLPDVERAVVACEGDLEAALRVLQEHSINLNFTLPPQVACSGFNPGIAPGPPLPPPGGWPQASPMHEAPGGEFFHPAAPRFDYRLERERDLVADWRSSHPLARATVSTPPRMINHGLSFPHHQQHHHHHHHHHHQQQLHHQEMFQYPAIPPQNMYHHQMNSGIPPGGGAGAGASGGWSSFESGGSWNVSSAHRVDYQAIDWSSGLPGKSMGLGASIGSLMRSSSEEEEQEMMLSSLMMGEQQQQQQQQKVIQVPGPQKMNGFGAPSQKMNGFSQEWTSPFAGKDLFHHHPVHSL